MAEDVDLVVVGGGVMGLFTAYYASAVFDRVVVLERRRIGDPTTASFGRTRSYRRDYLDPAYARLAEQAMGLWAEFERATGAEALVRCGCMNIAAKSITPDLATTYAQLATDTLDRLGMAQERLDAAQLEQRFPHLRADLGYLDPAAGLVDLGTVTATLQRELATRGAAVHEQTELTGVERSGGRIRVASSGGEFSTGAVVITAGHGTNDVLAQLPGRRLQVPITKDRPSEAKYFVPPPDQRQLFTADAMPVIAYLDTGVYVHPIVDGVIDAVKIGYYNPPDLPQQRTGIANIADFVAQCMPGLLEATSRDVLDVDQCDYDLVADDEFVLGAVPGQPGVYVGVGWRGTGYKFAPWVGRVLFELALRDGTIYDIARFDPARFAEPS
jgi:glycine/D-amino acid oxidase-like deaminating enzyme